MGANSPVSPVSTTCSPSTRARRSRWSCWRRSSPSPAPSCSAAAARTVRSSTAAVPTGTERDRPYSTDALPVGSLAPMSDKIVVRGAREHNLKNVSVELPARQAHRLHRAVRLGQVVARVRHDLRRGPAALRRVAVGLRPPVPRPDGQARRRLHRGPVAGDLDRPEVGITQPSLDRRHDHRGLRLPAAALRPHRRAALPERHHPARAPDTAADRRSGAAAARGHPVPGAGARGPRPQGRLRHAARRPGRAGLRAGPGRR